jgi:putative addiction module component (TIGR02574 family)
MTTTQEIIREIQSLPIEERTLLVDSLLRTLNSPEPAIDKAWASTAKRRLAELRTGSVQPVAAEQVFAHIQERFAR